MTKPEEMELVELLEAWRLAHYCSDEGDEMARRLRLLGERHREAITVSDIPAGCAIPVAISGPAPTQRS